MLSPTLARTIALVFMAFAIVAGTFAPDVPAIAQPYLKAAATAFTALAALFLHPPGSLNDPAPTPSPTVALVPTPVPPVEHTPPLGTVNPATGAAH